MRTVSAEATLSPVQGQFMHAVMDQLDGRPNAEVVGFVFDPAHTEHMLLLCTSGSALLHYAAGLLALRRALALMGEQQEWPRRAAILEALQTALPYLEAAGVAEPSESRAVLQ